MNRNMLLISGIVGVVVTATGCGGSEQTANQDTSADSGSIVIQAYSGVFQDNYQKAVVDNFTKKYPNIKVTYEGVTSSADNLAALTAAKSRPTADVSIMDLSVANTANKSGLFTPLDPTKVPNMADIDERGKVAGNFGPAVTYDSLVMIYNDRLKQPPTSWEQLWDPALKGRVVVTAHPDLQGTSLMLIENAKGGGDYATSVDVGAERLTELAPSVQTWAPQPDQYTLVQSGTADIAPAWNARAQFYAASSGGKLKVAIPDDKTVFQINTINLVKGGPSPAAAQTFIDYALSPEAQATFTNTMFYAPTNTKAQPAADALQRTAADPAKVGNVLDVDWATVSEKRESWTQIWRRQILTAS